MRIILTLYFLSVIVFAQAQNSKFIFNKNTIANGLASNDVLAIYQDTTGYIWIGTPNGLQRFDGIKFISLSVGTPAENALPIKQILGDKKGNIWLKVGNDYGIYDAIHFKFRKVNSRLNLPANSINYLKTDEAGNVVLIYQDLKVLRYNAALNIFDENLPFIIPDSFKIQDYYYDQKLNQYWLHGKQGIIIYDVKSGKLLTDKNSKHPYLNANEYHNVTKVFIDKERRIWVLYWPDKLHKEQYLCAFNERTGKFLKNRIYLKVSKSAYYEIKSFFENDNGLLWVYGMDVLGSFNHKMLEFNNLKTSLTAPGGINYSLINKVIEDKEHTIWIATDNGLYSCSSEKNEVKDLTLDNSNYENYINGLAGVGDQVWLANWLKGVIKVDSNFDIINKYSIARFDNVDQGLLWDICNSFKSRMVFEGAQHGWLALEDIHSHTIQYYNFPVFRKKTIRQVKEDFKGILWMGLQDGRIIKYDPDNALNNDNFHEIQSLHSIILKLYIDRKNQLWVCTEYNGLFCINTENGSIIHHYTVEAKEGKKLFDVSVTDISQINDSLYAIAANYFHILNINNDSIKRYSYNEGLAGNNISCLVSDRLSNVWISTPNGICRYNYTNNKFTKYNEKDGFIVTESSLNDAKLLSSGAIVMAGGNQLIEFNAEEFDKNIPPPPVTITGLKILNSYISLDFLQQHNGISLYPGYNSLTIYFSSLSYAQNDKLTYYYRFKENDKWLPANSSQSVSYTLLPYGQHTFQVKCENQSGISSPITEVNLFVQKPFYLSIWFLSLCIIFILVNIYLIYRSRINKLTAVEKMRFKVARDLHDDMGSTLSTINILSAMAKKRLNVDKEKTELYINKISDNSQSMMEAMDDIVWSIKPSNDSMQKIAGRMREFSTSVLEARDIDLEFKMDEKINSLKLNMASRRDFFLIFKEAINNLAKYSNASKASVHLTLNNKKLTLIIKDNGRGFDIEKSDSGNGLSNMKKRATLLKAKFQIESKPGVGTIVSVTMNV